MTRATTRTKLRAPLLAAAALAALVVAVLAAAALERFAYFHDAPPPPSAAPHKPSLAESPPEALRGSLMAREDIPRYLALGAPPRNPGPAQNTKPAECSPHALSERGTVLAEAHAYAAGFGSVLFDGRYATELFIRPKDGETASLADFAQSWIARCGSFTVSFSGSSEQYPAYALADPTAPAEEGRIGLKVLYAFAKSDPFRNEVLYYSIARVRGIDILVLSGLPGLSEDLVGKAVARLGAL